jgi:hypothetical protein
VAGAGLPGVEALIPLLRGLSNLLNLLLDFLGDLLRKMAVCNTFATAETVANLLRVRCGLLTSATLN